MPGGPKRWPAVLALVASLLGFAFAASSTLDYVRHLDRQIHDIHCSFIPGLTTTAQGADTACRVAMYSPYAALMRDRYWGGIPISLFALGAFAFFAAFSLYLLLAGPSAPRKSYQFLALAGVTPLLASLVMFIISAARLGQFCKTCVGIYIASALLAVAGIAAYMEDKRLAAVEASRPPRGVRIPGVPPTRLDDDRRGVVARRDGGGALIPAWLVALGAFALVPALLYVSAMPSYAGYVNGCGKLEKAATAESGVIKISAAGAKVPVTMFVDPLCPTCKAFHQRLVAEGYFEQLDTTLVLFPLDSDCNWMLDRPVHPGACIVSKAIICAEKRPLAVLDWAYDNQERLLEGAKAGAGLVNVKAAIREKFGDMDACIESKETGRRLDRMLRYIVQNHLPVSTPQLFVGDVRLCDEDTDIGLPYTLKKLAPQLQSR
jgi:uncharacterized membrane protein